MGSHRLLRNGYCLQGIGLFNERITGTNHDHGCCHIIGYFTSRNGSIRWEIPSKLRIEQCSGSCITASTIMKYTINAEFVTGRIAQAKLKGVLNDCCSGNAEESQILIDRVGTIGIAQSQGEFGYSFVLHPC